MTVLEASQMDIAAAVVAVHAFAAANIEPMMPRGPWLHPQPSLASSTVHAVDVDTPAHSFTSMIVAALGGVAVGICFSRGCSAKRVRRLSD